MRVSLTYLYTCPPDPVGATRLVVNPQKKVPETDETNNVSESPDRTLICGPSS